jgi:hypothetical protein
MPNQISAAFVMILKFEDDAFSNISYLTAKSYIKMVHVQQAGKRGDVPEKTKHAFCNIT